MVPLVGNPPTNFGLVRCGRVWGVLAVFCYLQRSISWSDAERPEVRMNAAIVLSAIWYTTSSPSASLKGDYHPQREVVPRFLDGFGLGFRLRNPKRSLYSRRLTTPVVVLSVYMNLGYADCVVYIILERVHGVR